MAKTGKKIVCGSCGFKNTAPLDKGRCVSCGALIDEVGTVAIADEGNPYQQSTFQPKWFMIALVVMSILTAGVVFGLPVAVPLFDFEGQAGMMVSIPVWFLGGLLVGLISPGRTFMEPVAAVLIVALPTAFILQQGQTVKTMPVFLYILFSALGLLFTLIGAYTGERIQVQQMEKSA